MQFCDDCQSVHYPGHCRKQLPTAAPAYPYNFYFGFRYAAQVYSTVSDPAQTYDGYADNRADPKLCLHCQPNERAANHIHGCDGNGCQCALCNPDTGLLSTLIEELKKWDWLERWGLAYTKKKP